MKFIATKFATTSNNIINVKTAFNPFLYPTAFKFSINKTLPNKGDANKENQKIALRE